MSETPTKTEQFARTMELVAYHIRCIESDPPGKFGLSIGGRHFRVTILERSKKKSPKIWDQVYIALDTDAPDDIGTWCGNRAGGAKTLSNLYAEDLIHMYGLFKDVAE
jgi:hypothetical protein